MIQRLPGFVLELGSGARGFEGATGNILIDGKPPATKTESLDLFLRRLPSSEVARIEILYPGAAGFDLNGRSQVVNIVRKPSAPPQSRLSASNQALSDGRNFYALRLDTSHRADRFSWQAGALRSYSPWDFKVGEGSRLRSNPDGSVLSLASMTRGEKTVRTH